MARSAATTIWAAASTRPIAPKSRRSPTRTCGRSPTPRDRKSPSPAYRRARASRIGIDRDGDGYGDGDEIDDGSDPADAGERSRRASRRSASRSRPSTFKSATMSDKSRPALAQGRGAARPLHATGGVGERRGQRRPDLRRRRRRQSDRAEGVELQVQGAASGTLGDHRRQHQGKAATRVASSPSGQDQGRVDGGRRRRGRDHDDDHAQRRWRLLRAATPSTSASAAVVLYLDRAPRLASVAAALPFARCARAAHPVRFPARAVVAPPGPRRICPMPSETLTVTDNRTGRTYTCPSSPTPSPPPTCGRSKGRTKAS